MTFYRGEMQVLETFLVAIHSTFCQVKHALEVAALKAHLPPYYLKALLSTFEKSLRVRHVHLAFTSTTMVF